MIDTSRAQGSFLETLAAPGRHSSSQVLSVILKFLLSSFRFTQALSLTRPGTWLSRLFCLNQKVLHSSVIEINMIRYILASLFVVVPIALQADDVVWLQQKGTLVFRDTFERDEEGNLAKAIGNGWNSATADRVPQIKMADLDSGVLKITSATKEAGHAAHIHHEAGFTDGGAIVRFKFPGLNSDETLQLGFVDRETKGVHAGHLCYGIISRSSIKLIDHKTGIMNLEIRKRLEDARARKETVPADLEALQKAKQVIVSHNADHEWHDLVLVTEGDEMRLSLDGKLMAKHRSQGYAHPVKRWFSFLVPNTVWIDDVQIWKVQ